jgi:protein-disulfide isomerase
MAIGSGLDLGEATGAIPGNGDSPGSSPSDGSDGSGSTSTVDVSSIETEGEPVLGESDAPVTMVVYEDFQCPFCQRFENGAVQQVESEYVESGQVKIIWKDFPLPSLGHNWAEPSAKTMECVYRQSNDAFWALKDKVFNNQNTISEQTVEEQIIGWATQEGVSESAVRSCLENGNPMEEVNADKQEGRNFDTVIQTPQGPRQFISGTPSSVIYGEGDSEGEPIIGAQPFSVIQNTIDSKLEG